MTESSKVKNTQLQKQANVERQKHNNEETQRQQAQKQTNNKKWKRQKCRIVQGTETPPFRKTEDRQTERGSGRDQKAVCVQMLFAMIFQCVPACVPPT